MYQTVTFDKALSFDTEKLINITLKNWSYNEPTNYYITGAYSNEGWTTKNGFLKTDYRKQNWLN